jgi:hypothetical protein
MLPALWAGVLLSIAAIAAPAAFGVLPRADAGRVVSHIFVVEAWTSLALAGVLLGLQFGRHAVERKPVRTERTLLWGAIGCTLLGYFVLQPLMSAARAGHGAIGFGQLHLISTAFYALKTALVLWLAWRAAAALSRPPSS